MVVVNQRGEIVLLNVQAEKQFGYRRDELIGQKVTNIIPVGFAERLIADDLRSTEDASTQQIGTGIELIALRKDGGEFPIEIMLSPLDSAEGTLVTAAFATSACARPRKRIYRKWKAATAGSGSGPGCDGGGEPGRRDRSVECPGGEAVRLSP